MWLWAFQAGAPSLSDDKRTVLCDDQIWIDTLQWLVDFYDNYVGDFESVQQGLQSAGLGLPFVAGKTSIENSTWTLSLDALRNWTHGCGSVMGVAALQHSSIWKKPTYLNWARLRIPPGACPWTPCATGPTAVAA